MLNRFWRRGSPLALLVGVLLAAVPLLAQSTTGSLQGTVKDEQQAVVIGATVTVRNVDTNATYATITDSQGRWRVPQLPVGNYEVKVELTGFATILRTGIGLLLNQDAVVDVTMKTATVSETITVSGERMLGTDPDTFAFEHAGTLLARARLALHTGASDVADNRFDIL